jgi:hypothetical protein
MPRAWLQPHHDKSSHATFFAASVQTARLIALEPLVWSTTAALSRRDWFTQARHRDPACRKRQMQLEEQGSKNGRSKFE